MGGGQDSRIPSLLREYFSSRSMPVDVVIRTYSFDPEAAWTQIQAWAVEQTPDLIIGESLGSNHAYCLCPALPHLYVSPAMNAPAMIARYAPLARIPGVTAFLNRFFRPTRPMRQTMDFRPEVMRRYASLDARVRESLADSKSGRGESHAFFGRRDHYFKWGVVDPAGWNDVFGTSEFYEGTHFMENEFVESMLIPKVLEYYR